MRIWIVDAFTDRPFAGNPAGVCLLDTPTWPDDAWMRQLAAELHLETAFAQPLPADADWALRWFTATAESNLCGHATLATAHALHRHRGTPGTIRFASRFGVLIAHTRNDGPITLDFPAAPPIQAPAPDGLAEALGATPQAAYRTGALGDLLAVLSDEATVRALTPDRSALTELTRRDGIRGIIATAAAAHPDRGYDFVSRYFAPAGAVLVRPVGPRPPGRAAGLQPHRPGRHRRPRRPRPPHRPRRHHPRRHPPQSAWVTPGGAGRAHHHDPWAGSDGAGLAAQ
jgi:PhzF family phenazine biosynthesis protein